MHNTSTTYNSIYAGNHAVLYKLSINGVTYNASKIIMSRNKTVRALLDSLTIGKAVIGYGNFDVVDQGNIPTMASVNLFAYLQNPAGQVSEDIPKGQFFISKRKYDVNGIVTLNVYDGMRKACQVFLPEGSTWSSTTTPTLLNLLAQKMFGTGYANYIDSATKTYITNHSKNVDYVPIMGTNGTTVKQMLEYIALLYGGNFAMTDDGKLKLYRLKDMASASQSEDLSVKMSQLYIAPAYTAIGQITLVNESSEFHAGTSGYELRIETPYASQAMANSVLSEVQGYIYQPYIAENVEINPAVELGDKIKLNGTVCSVFSQELSMNSQGGCYLSAPFNSELEEEYPATNDAAIDVAQKINKNTQRIEVADGKIALVVDANDNIRAAQIVLAINDESSEALIKAGKVAIEGDTTFASLIYPGTTKINGGQIQTDTIALNSIQCLGTMLEVKNASGVTLGYLGEGTGYDGHSTTNGVIFSNADGTGYMIITNRGARITFNGKDFYISNDGIFYDDGGGNKRLGQSVWGA